MITGFKSIIFTAVIITICVFLIPGTGIAKEGYAGTKSCVICHQPQNKAYESNAHGRVTEKWVEEGLDKGIGCEACHGPGQAHVDIGLEDLNKLKKKKGDFKILGKKNNKKGEFCIACHRLTDNDNIELATENLIKFGQEHSELSRSKKAQFKLTCGSCHDPHITIKDEKGLKRKCLDCHKGKFRVDVDISAMKNLTCEACHMPYVVTTGEGKKINDFHKGEYRSHVFGITVDPAYKLNDGTMHMSLTDKGLARLTVDTTCFACHKTGKAHDMTRAEMLKNAVKIHESYKVRMSKKK